MARIIKGKSHLQEVKAVDTPKELNDNYAKLKLYLSDDEESRISDIQKETLIEELESFPPAIKGNVNISGVYAFDMGEFVEVKVFIRNAANRPINLEEIPLMIVDSNGDVLAYQTFNFKKMGTIPALSARPWKLNFDKKNLTVDAIPKEGWKIGFDNRLETKSYKKIEFESLPEEMSEQNKYILRSFLTSLPKLESGEVSASKFSMGISEHGNFMITIVVRNARNNDVAINKLPVTVLDESGNEAFSTEFDLNNFKVSSNKARLINLVYETNIELGEQRDLTDWTLKFE